MLFSASSIAFLIQRRTRSELMSGVSPSDGCKQPFLEPCYTANTNYFRANRVRPSNSSSLSHLSFYPNLCQNQFFFLHNTSAQMYRFTSCFEWIHFFTSCEWFLSRIPIISKLGGRVDNDNAMTWQGGWPQRLSSSRKSLQTTIHPRAEYTCSRLVPSKVLHALFSFLVHKYIISRNTRIHLRLQVQKVFHPAVSVQRLQQLIVRTLAEALHGRTWRPDIYAFVIKFVFIDTAMAITFYHGNSRGRK